MKPLIQMTVIALLKELGGHEAMVALSSHILDQGWANYGPFGNFSRPPNFNGQHIFIGLPSLYVIRRLN